MSERLEYIPARVVVHRTVRPHYSCPCCESVHAVPLPPQLIEKGQPGPGLLAQVTVAECSDHLPHMDAIVTRQDYLPQDVPHGALTTDASNGTLTIILSAREVNMSIPLDYTPWLHEAPCPNRAYICPGEVSDV